MGLVEVQVEARETRQTVPRSEFFITEPWSKPEAQKETFKPRSVRQLVFDFLTDLVSGIATARRGEQAFVSEEAPRWLLARPGSAAKSGRLGGNFGADSEDRSAAAEVSAGCVEERVPLENGFFRLGAKMMELSQKAS